MIIGKKLLLTIWCCVLCIACTQAQVDDTYMTTSDSAAFVNANWNSEKMDGFVLKRHHFTHKQIFASNQNFCIIEVPVNSKKRLYFAYDTILTETSVQAQRHKAVAAINGTFFDMDKGNPVCFLKIDTTIVGYNVPSKKDTVNRKYYQSGTIVLNNGKMNLIPSQPSRVWEERLDFANMMTAGPLLIHKGQSLEMRMDRTFVTARHNRTAIGLKKDGTLVMLVVDGRFKDKCEGLSLPELIQVMRWMGCTEAINLDGGGSSTLYINGYGSNGIVNYPSDNRKFDHDGERPVSNILYLK